MPRPDRVWQWQLDGDNVGAAPAIYQVKGKSYVALTSDGTKPKLFRLVTST